MRFHWVARNALRGIYIRVPRSGTPECARDVEQTARPTARPTARFVNTQNVAPGASRIYQSASKLVTTLGKETRFQSVAPFKADTFYCTAFELARVKSHAISTKSTPGTTQTICCPMNPIQ